MKLLGPAMYVRPVSIGELLGPANIGEIVLMRSMAGFGCLTGSLS